MKLTIAIPTYNGGESLIRTVSTCVPKGFRDGEYEILVIDNVSTDDSTDRLRKEVQNPNLRIEKNERNLGRLWNWNRALELSRGEAILFVMVSDELDRNTDFAKAVELSLRPGICAVYSYYADFGNGEKLISTSPGENVRPVNVALKDSLESLGKIGGFPPLQLHFLKSSAIRGAGLRFEEKWPFLADAVFLTEYASLFENVEYRKEPLVHWKLGDSRFTSSSQMKIFEEFPSVYEYLFSKHLHRNPKSWKMRILLGAQAMFLWAAYSFRGKKLDGREVLSYCFKGKFGALRAMLSLFALPWIVVCAYFQGKGRLGASIMKTLKC